jgi:hypothetical protein
MSGFTDPLFGLAVAQTWYLLSLNNAKGKQVAHTFEVTASIKNREITVSVSQQSNSLALN